MYKNYTAHAYMIYLSTSGHEMQVTSRHCLDMGWSELCFGSSMLRSNAPGRISPLHLVLSPPLAPTTCTLFHVLYHTSAACLHVPGLGNIIASHGLSYPPNNPSSIHIRVSAKQCVNILKLMTACSRCANGGTFRR